MTKSILVTGGAGFIGSHLVDRLLSEGGWHVTVVDDLNDFYSPEIKRTNLDSARGNPNFEFVELDIRNCQRLRDVFDRREFGCIVHLAARAGVRPSLREPKLYVETNINGTMNLLELARDYEVRQFVFGSSSSVYGINCKIPFSEDDRIHKPISPYAATKAAGESIDDKIRTRAEHWRIERMAIVDRNVLRLAVYEFLFEDTPHTVVINEALEIARRFSTFEATQFINGILDAIKLDLEKAAGEEVPKADGKSSGSA